MAAALGGGRLAGRALGRTTLCRIARCRRTVGTAGGGEVLCAACWDRLVGDLTELPALYSDCGPPTGPGGVREIRRTRRRTATAGPIDPAAVDTRAAILSALASWAGLVAAGRGVRPPARELPALARFLAHNVDWLARHPAVGDLADELHELARAARGTARPTRVRRIRLGRCPGAGCDGEVVALVEPDRGPRPARIVCTATAGHSWPVTWWSKLARQLADPGERP